MEDMRSPSLEADLAPIGIGRPLFFGVGKPPFENFWSEGEAPLMRPGLEACLPIILPYLEPLANDGGNN